MWVASAAISTESLATLRRAAVVKESSGAPDKTLTVQSAAFWIQLSKRAVRAGPIGIGKTTVPITVVHTIPRVISSTRDSTTSQTVPGASTIGKPINAAL